MGTNFYIGTVHIGKRSAAGWYCWDCGVSLCQGNPHSDAPWFDCCPECGKAPVRESMDSSSAGRELGFNTSAPAAKTGVASCSSFNWAMHPFHFCMSRRRIKDEYGRTYAKQAFFDMLSEYPIQRYQSIGKEFS